MNMAKVLIIGAGGVSSVVVHKCAQAAEVFDEIVLASRTKPRCDAIAASVRERTGRSVETARVDADNVPELVELIRRVRPQLVMNIALPYQDLHIMDACLETGVHYLDTANYEPLDTAKFEYKWQWAYQKKFQEKGLMALLGSGFDPGVTNVFCAYAQKHLLDEIHVLDIIDANAGDHGLPFATNFNPEINIREVSARGRYWERGEWVETDPLSWKMSFDFPEGIGPKNCYLMYHEELESLVLNLRGIRRARFWMTFSDNYLNHLQVLKNVGMTSIEPVQFQGQEIVPLQFLAGMLPDPSRPPHQRQDLHRLPHARRQGRPAPHRVRLQHLRSSGMLPGTRFPGHFLHHRRARHGRRDDDAHRKVDEARRLEHGTDGPRSLP